MNDKSESYNKKNRLPKEYCNLEFDEVITSWDEAIPIGNGEIGCLLWGKSNAFRLSLDRTDIWDIRACKETIDENFNYETLIKLAKEKKEQEIREKFDQAYNHPTPTKLPAGKIIFDFAEDYSIQSKLSLSDAEATIQMSKGNEKITLNSYIHATDRVGFIKVDQPLSAFNYRIDNPEFSIKTEAQGEEDVIVDSVSTSSLKLLYYSAPIISNEVYKKWFIQPIDGQMEYGVFVVAKETIQGTEFVYHIATSKEGENWSEEAQKRILHYIEKGYDECLKTHKEWWINYWNKSSITLPNKFFEKNWYLTNYLFASCSRKNCYPMPLQGVWTADNDALPPWKGDYHHDLNTQMSYWHYLKANHIEEGESFIDFLWELVPVAREFAKTFYNTEGICLPAVMTINGMPLPGWPMYSLAPTNQLWLCHNFERHYRFLGDDRFLEEKVYPYFSESMECILGLMSENDEGKYVLPVSSSPEIHDDTAQAWVTPNSNYDLALIQYAVKQLIEFSIILNNGNVKYWKDIFEKLPSLAINKYNMLMISPDENLGESHRHHAHMMAVHPLRLMTMEDEKEKDIINTSIRHLETLGTGLWVGFSFTWMSEFYAIQGNGNGAAYQLEVFWRNCCSQNGFNLNGDYKNCGVSQFHYRPFTLEANMCAADALQEMLLQSENDLIEFFPALPQEWNKEKITFEDFCVGKGLLVSGVLEKGQLMDCTFKPKQNQIIRIKISNGVEKLKFTSDHRISIDNKFIEIDLKSGEVYHFKK